MHKLMNSVKEWRGSRKESTPELNRSQYSLVSCGELTAGAVQLWLGLPEEVKYDPALAPFRKFYEKEHGESLDVYFFTPLFSSTVLELPGSWIYFE